MSKMSNLHILLTEIKEEMCDHYCKWPDQWSEVETIEMWSGSESAETIINRMPLEESDICKNCPLNRLRGAE